MNFPLRSSSAMIHGSERSGGTETLKRNVYCELLVSRGKWIGVLPRNTIKELKGKDSAEFYMKPASVWMKARSHISHRRNPITKSYRQDCFTRLVLKSRWCSWLIKVVSMDTFRVLLRGSRKTVSKISCAVLGMFGKNCWM